MASCRGLAKNFLSEATYRMIPIDQLQHGVETLRCCIQRELFRGNILPESTGHLGCEELRRNHNSGASEHVEYRWP